MDRWTQRELAIPKSHYAVSQKKTVLAFIHNDVGNIATNKTDTDGELQKKLAAFRKEVGNGRLVQLWSSREELRAVSLHKAIIEYPAVGWMRASAAASEDLLAQINQLRLENDELRSRAVAPFDSPEILAPPESSFRIQYRYQEYDGRMTRTLLGTVSVDWRTLLVLLAPQFVTPRKNIVASLLSAALKEEISSCAA